jgi:hypothetical protein
MARKWFQWTKDVVQTPTITAGAYSANDAVGGKLTFDVLGGQYIGGIVKTIVITDKEKQDAEFDLILFNQDFTPTADNAAFDPSDTDLLNCIGLANIASTDYLTFVDNSAAIKGGLSISIKSEDSDGKIYGQLVTRGTPTYTSTSDLQVRLIVELDRS